jgi:ribonucleoside-diphosphate reductase alpha chain
VSATVSLKEDDWKPVGEWMWENREYYNGLSVLPYDGGTYTQAPFEDIEQSKYEELSKVLHDINVSNIVEVDDNTDLKDQVACAADGCEVS